MIKNIKRVGIIFLAVAIICLVVTCCLSVNSVTGIANNSNNLSNSAMLDSNVNSVENRGSIQIDVPDISKEVILDGENNAAQATKWTEAVQLALQGNHVLVKLEKDWVADSTPTIGFCEEDRTGFVNHNINVPKGVAITIDLQGKMIDRHLFDYVENGGVIKVDKGATLTIKDSTYDSDRVFDAYNNNNQGELVYSNSYYEIVKGKITGGHSRNTGGCINITGGNLIFESGMIYNNRTASRGAGIYANQSNIIFKNGVIFNNVAESASNNGAGAIYLISSALDFYNGVVYKNSATRERQDDGGALVLEYTSSCNIFDGIFAKNSAEDAGGFAVVRGTSTFNINGGKFEYNSAGCDGGAIYAPQGIVNINNAYFAYNRSEYGSAIDYSGNAQCTIKNTTITKNYALLYAGGIYSRANNNLEIGKNVKIYDNTAADDKASDILLTANSKINVIESLEGSKIGIELHNTYGTDSFTIGYETKNKNVAPYNYFFNNNDASIATTNGGEVIFEKTISSGVYDFIYLENGKRTNYKDKDLIHTTNDFDLRQNVNGGKLVLGGVLTNTSVNEFLQNLKFEGNTLKLFDGANNLIYDYSNLQTGYNSLFDDSDRLSVGTGWKIEVYSTTNHKVEEIYISVLGDLTGDGKINSADVNYLRRLVNDKEMYNELDRKPYIQLATLLIKSSTLLDSDADILWGVVCGTSKIEYFM